jgi:hypothetical protein
MTPARVARRRRKRAAVVASVASSLLIGGGGAAMGQELVEALAPASEAGTGEAGSAEEVAADASPSPSPDLTGGSKTPPYRLRARVKPGPSSTFGSPKTFPVAMSGVRKGSCQQTHDVIWDGKPKVSRVKVRMVREQGNPENTSVTAPSGACAAKKQKKSGYKLRVKVSYPTPSGNRASTGKVKLPKAFNVLANKMNAMRDKVLQSGNTATFKLKLLRVKKPVPGMIGGLARRYGLSVTKSLSVAKCESGFDPKAYNPAGPWAGVYQQDTDHWPQRSKKFGHPGESVFKAYANVDVSLKMARSMGWHHWACA